jgi:surface antigen
MFARETITAAVVAASLAGVLKGQRIATRVNASDRQRAYDAERASVMDDRPDRLE